VRRQLPLPGSAVAGPGGQCAPLGVHLRHSSSCNVRRRCAVCRSGSPSLRPLLPRVRETVSGFSRIGCPERELQTGVSENLPGSGRAGSLIPSSFDQPGIVLVADRSDDAPRAELGEHQFVPLDGNCGVLIRNDVHRLSRCRRGEDVVAYVYDRPRKMLIVSALAIHRTPLRLNINAGLGIGSIEGPASGRDRRMRKVNGPHTPLSVNCILLYHLPAATGRAYSVLGVDASTSAHVPYGIQSDF